MKISLFIFVVFFTFALGLKEVQVSLDQISGTEIRVTLYNPNDAKVSFSRSNTPFLDHIFSNLFCVRKSGHQERLRYIGALGKLLETEIGFVFIEPRSIVEKVVDLHGLYKFEEQGTYEIEYCGSMGSLGYSSNKLHININEDVLTKTKEYLISVNNMGKPIQYYKSYGFADWHPSACESTAIAALDSAVNAGHSGAYASMSRVKNAAYRSTFDLWFGNFSTTLGNLMETRFQSISDAFTDSFVTQCGGNHCYGNVIAYVYPTNNDHRMYLCDVFFDSIPASYGVYDTQPGTILHEMSHFVDVVGTDDYTYGVASCQDLAQYNPEEAVMNADSYELYTEDQYIDSPFTLFSSLSMGSSWSSSEKNICFIATAAFGSALHPKVQVLRDFRDDFLITNSLGTYLVEMYYRHSPVVANVISEDERLRMIVRMMLYPLIYTIEYPITTVITVVLSMLSISILRRALVA